ncbi:YTH domain-containing protein ECT4 isoform X2 [Andrographis paniculata]|uniref:YTH domain-containing protein ECT4 isoform X2 n=1 Tax=Andrographis paniculata TaxID=175694 RepID=UPI0021E928E3|nr:YTH domain-containing protein ECT4 isoform X2 [Andrographis paniculata]
MAAVAPPAEQLLQKLSLETQTKGIEISDATKKPSIDSSNVSNVITSDRSVTPALPDFGDPAVCYLQSGYPFYYGGYDGSGNDWEEYARYINQEGGVDMPSAVYGENGSLMYHPGYGYAPYPPYSPAATPVPTVAHDGHIYGAQQYQYPAPYFQSMTQTSGPHPTPAANAKGEIAASAAADQAALPVESTNSKSNGVANSGGPKGGNGAAPTRMAYQNSSFNVNGSYGRGLPASGYQDPRYGFDALQSPILWPENHYFSDGQPRPATSSSATSVANGNGFNSSRSQNYRPHPMGLHHPRPVPGLNAASGYISRMYPNKLYSQYGNAFRSGLGFGASGYDARVNGRGWMAVDSKYKPRGRGNSLYNCNNENIDGLNELNRGPRAKTSKNPKSFSPAALVVKGQNIPLTGKNDNEEKSSLMPDREQYNLPDFPVAYDDAKFFIIKSYSEDDVHKSIKYNVWSSTPNGNKKLDAAYQEAQQKPGNCPVFLFFSVNTSGQFVGAAEMTGPVDFNKNVEYWQQDKWIGCFPVKWHIVKDVPNSLLKHITLENNENKPVTNSRDTQEVKLEQGLQVLKIFKEHISKQCILDDFDFYEDRQKKIQEKKAKQQQYQKQVHVWEGKPTEDKNKDGANDDVKFVKSSEVASDSNKQATPQVQSNTNTEIKIAEIGTLTKLGESTKTTTKPAAAVVEKKPIANGVANGC